jgi:hypothetical protein
MLNHASESATGASEKALTIRAAAKKRVSLFIKRPPVDF